MAAIDEMAVALVEDRLHAEAERVMDAWDNLANLVGCALEGHATVKEVGAAELHLAAVEGRARAEIAEALAMLGESS